MAVPGVQAAAQPAANGAAALLPVPHHAMTSGLDILYGYLGVFIVAFIITLLATPMMRRLAVNHGIIDRPLEARKAHRVPVAYLGGVAVFLGLMGGIVYSFLAPVLGARLPFDLFTMHDSALEQSPVPLSILLGMTLIMLTGLVDDVASLDPRLKVAGQLLAAAAMALDDVGTRVAKGLMTPVGQLVGNPDLTYHIRLPAEMPFGLGASIELDVIYWAGTAIIAMFVLGACNASNLIDGLDGLLSGVTSIAAGGLLFIALGLAALQDGHLDSARVILALALMGACLGFLPHNFNPATIFLGDCGSLLLGYMTITIVLTLGDTGKTHLVVAGLIIYAIPIIDTFLAIVRRKMAGRPMSSADDQHLHHQLKRAFGVKGAVFTLYGIGLTFAILGVWLSTGRVRVVFTIAMVIAAFIGVTAVKVARRQAIEAQMLGLGSGKPSPGSATSAPAVSSEAEKPRRPAEAPATSPRPTPVS